MPLPWLPVRGCLYIVRITLLLFCQQPLSSLLSCPTPTPISLSDFTFASAPKRIPGDAPGGCPRAALRARCCWQAVSMSARNGRTAASSTLVARWTGMARRRSQQAYELPAGRMVNGFSTRRSGTARARRCVSCIAEAAGSQTCFIFIGDKHAYNGLHRAGDLRVLEQHLLPVCYRCFRSGVGGRMRLIAQYRQAFMPHAYQLHERSACCLNL